jgi:hypothetical protein
MVIIWRGVIAPAEWGSERLIASFVTKEAVPRLTAAGTGRSARQGVWHRRVTGSCYVLMERFSEDLVHLDFHSRLHQQGDPSAVKEPSFGHLRKHLGHRRSRWITTRKSFGSPLGIDPSDCAPKQLPGAAARAGSGTLEPDRRSCRLLIAPVGYSLSQRR